MHLRERAEQASETPIVTTSSNAASPDRNQKPILVFDVNETLLDLDSVKPHFRRMFGDAAAMREWFNLVILYSEASSMSNIYVDFGKLGGAVLNMLAETKGVKITPDDLIKVKDAIAAMPPHNDVHEGLIKLQAAGFRMVTLTNNPRETCQQQLERGGIRKYFEQLFSIDDGVRRYKPAQESYSMVADAVKSTPAGLWLIACHTWDTMGAAAAGWSTALITRTGNAPISVGREPDFVGSDLIAVADALISRYPS